MIYKYLSSVVRPAFSTYTKAMHQAWQQDAKQVHQDWDAYFKNNPASSASSKSPASEKDKDLALSAYMLIRYYKSRGHQIAELDPLRLVNFQEFGKVYVKHSLDSDLKKNNIIQEHDLDTPFSIPILETFSNNIAGFLKERSQWTLRQINDKLHKIYSNKIALQFMYISDPQERTWIMHKFEALQNYTCQNEDKIQILEELTKTEAFNSFLSDKLKTSKRFGVEGLDSMISGLNKLVQSCSKSGIQYIGVGMAHRGRLNALANVFQKPLQRIFAEFQENVDKQQSWGNSGDVKYHLGTTVQRQFQGRKIKVSILPNPSHLETVNPVVMGHVKAVEDYLKNDDKSLAVLIHGDAALAGQGIVYQCLQMSSLEHYKLNGVIHIVANNQIGFTTTPAEARTGLYCTDIAKSIQAPVIHVNGDQPELVNQAMQIAIDYRQRFHKDIFIDIIGYRRYGHNQQDQPAFTQPMMYQQISKRPNIHRLYSNRLVNEGVITEHESNELWNKHIKKISDAYAESYGHEFDISKWKSPTYHRVVDFTNLGEVKRTGVKKDELIKLGQTLCQVPKDFTINPTIKKIYEHRQKSIETGQGIDFGTAQSLAFASLIKDGFNVRLSGQDVERGTFSHRHAVLVDQNTQKKFTPLHQLIPRDQTRFQVQNSLLSQYAALGFQYGYSMTNPNTLTIWEAQFGDFANGAQIIIDNYLTSGQSKWNVSNGLVMNLPHGNDGQGPQHTSARIERYLQLVDDGWTNLLKGDQFHIEQRAIKKGNLQVINCSNAGNFFHAMRRQMRRDYRKPLINFVSKKLLKMKQASTTYQVLNRDRFQTIIDEPDAKINPKQVRKVVLLSGQAYYSALERRTQLNRKDVALIRVQQIAPFHYTKFIQIVQRYPNAKEYVWFQQEHRNGGAWGYLNPRISVTLEWLHRRGKITTSNLDCISRKNSASTGAGKKKKHDEEHNEILTNLFST